MLKVVHAIGTHWRLRAFLFGILLCGLSALQPLVAQKCCDDVVCKEQAVQQAKRLTKACAFLTKDIPEPIDSAYAYLNRLSRTDPTRYTELMRAFGAFVRWSDQGDSTANRTLCLYDVIEDGPADWTVVIDKRNYMASQTLSPEFQKGLHFQWELDAGGIDIGRDSEGFLGSARLLLSYTFGHKEDHVPKATGGKWRVLLGAVPYYSRDELALAGDLRLTFRVKDIKMKEFVLGNWQLFSELQFMDQHPLLGLGTAFEFQNHTVLGGISADVRTGGIMAYIGYGQRMPLCRKCVERERNNQYDRQ